MAPFVTFAARFLSPLASIFSFLAVRAVHLLGSSVAPDQPLITPAHLRFLVEMGEDQGALEETERDILDSILEFGETTVREIMRPRMDMVMVPITATLEEVAYVMRDSGYSRIPVYRENRDDIVGVAYVRDVLEELQKDSTRRTLEEIELREPFFVPETKRISELLVEFRQRRTHMAIVVDEYGGTAGLVTLEDVLEELVGEIQDEFDREQPLIQPLSDQSYLVDPRIEAEDFQKAIGVDLSPGDYTTLGGFLLTLSGQIPEPGQTFVCGGRYSRLEFEIIEVRRHRVTKVRVHVRRLDEEEVERVRVRVEEDGSLHVQDSTPMEVVARLLGVEIPPEVERQKVGEFLERTVGASPQPGHPIRWNDLLIETVEGDGYRINRMPSDAETD